MNDPVAIGDPGQSSLRTTGGDPDAGGLGWVIETTISPFHCLYQDALHFHTQSKRALSRSEGEASRLARASLTLYLASAEALVHQAAVELGRPELIPLLADPGRPLPLSDAWRILPAVVSDGPTGPFLPDQAPWPQFAELLTLRASWAYPGHASDRRAYYRAPRRDADFEPIQPHQAAALGVPASRLFHPRTGLPRDPYALRPHHLDTARGVLDAAIDALDRRLGGALTRDQRQRREPVRLLPTAGTEVEREGGESRFGS
ncbi:MAG: hypothetical protein AB7I30_01140 [Isosphaeraceae bacterium]